MSLEVEQTIIGMILKKNELAESVIVKPEFFIDGEEGEHGKILKILIYAYKRLKSLDPQLIPTLWAGDSESQQKKLQRYYSLLPPSRYMLLTGNVVGLSEKAFNEYQKSIIKEYTDKVRGEFLFEVSRNQEISTAEITSKLEELEALNEIGQDRTVDAKVFLKSHVQELMNRRNNMGRIGAKTCMYEYNEMAGGHRRKELTIIGARPSMGKTALFCNDIMNTSDDGWTPFVATLEMSTGDLIERMICADAGIDISRMSNGTMTDSDWDRYTYSAERIDNKTILFDDTPAMSIQYIKRKVRELKKKYPKLILYTDYLQLVTSEDKHGSVREKYDFISASFKNIAKEFDIPVVVISAVGREVDKRPDKRPMKSDLKESGQIEFDADVIIFLYRDEYYYPETKLKGIVEIILSKGRNVGTGIFRMLFQANKGRFLNPDEKIRERIKKQVEEHEREKNQRR